MGKASAAETQSHLYIALDQGYLNEKQFHILYDHTETYARRVSALITYRLRGKRPPTQETP
jgi:four helix bundle protein